MEIERPAPSEPSRLPVDALTLTASGVDAEGRRRSPRASPRGAGRGAAGAATIVRSTPAGRQPRVRRGATTTSARSSRAVDAGAASRRRPGTAAQGRRARRRRAAHRRAHAGRRRRPSGRAAAERPAISMPPSRSGSPGPNGCASCPIPVRRRGDRAGEQVGGAREIGGHGHLEIGGIAGNDMDGDSTGLQEGGLIGPRPSPASADGERRAQEAAPDALRGLGRRQPGAIDGRRDHVAVDPLEGLGHRHDRDGRAVARRSRRRRPRRARGMTSGPRAVVDEDDPVASRIGQARSSASNPARDRVLAPARRRRRTSRRSPAGSHGAVLELAPTVRRRHDHDRRRPPARPRARRACQASSGRRRSARGACRCRPSAPRHRPPRRSRRRRTLHAGHRPRAAQSSRGWAKIIRPATVWRTRVDGDVEVLVDMPRAALDHDHRAVIEEADALPGLLALLDHPDPQLLAGEYRWLHGIGQRVDVHDPHALQLGDAVEVEVVRQDRPAPGLAPARRAWRPPRRLGRDVVLDDLDRGPRLLLHPGQDLEPAPAAIAAQRVGASRRCAAARRGRTSGRPACRR